MSLAGAVPIRSRWDGIAVHLRGASAYVPTWHLQQRLHEMRGALRLPDTLLLLEHRPVVTLGRHARAENVLSGCDLEVVRIDRGGDVTYHGPGQLTGYFLCDLRAHDLSVRGFVTALEEGVIRALAEFGIAGERRAGLTGVWVRGAASAPAPAGDWAKIAAIGVRVARGVSLHGFALNVAGPLDGFARIVPCGLEGEAVTSMERIVVRQAPEPVTAPAAPGSVAPGSVAPGVARHLGEVFGVEFRWLESPPVHNDAGADRLAERIEVAAAHGGRRPSWLLTRLPGGECYATVRQVLREGKLRTVCESARCPNAHECWNAGTATFLILGGACTRGCHFCAVPSCPPEPPDPAEPAAVALAASQLGLRHVVVTSVTRDDLPDGGAAHFAATIRAVREVLGSATVEVLIPDFGGDPDALDRVLAEHPEVLNHNVETVVRLYPRVRPGADYRRSLALLRRASNAGLRAKSGLMIGLGESPVEVRELLRDLRDAGCAHVTIGQYLQPSRRNLTVKRYYHDAEFAELKARALELGIAHVDAGPRVRSSYHAERAMEARGATPAP
jgi:lipoic acid synthetase